MGGASVGAASASQVVATMAKIPMEEHVQSSLVVDASKQDAQWNGNKQQQRGFAQFRRKDKVEG